MARNRQNKLKHAKNEIFSSQDGTLRNGDHLLAVGDVRLWGMGAEQVASILRQAGQDSIRLVVARPVDPTVPQFAVRLLSFFRPCWIYIHTDNPCK